MEVTQSATNPRSFKTTPEEQPRFETSPVEVINMVSDDEIRHIDLYESEEEYSEEEVEYVCRYTYIDDIVPKFNNFSSYDKIQELNYF